MNDPYGKEIKIGSKVAYNYCGQLRIGTVTSYDIKEQKITWGTDWTNRYKIYVKEQQQGFTSIVRSPLNMVVLDEKSTDN